LTEIVDTIIHNVGFKNYAGIIKVPEMLIDFYKAKEHFNNLKLNIKYNTHCYYQGNQIFSNRSPINCDLIIDCTYGQLKCPSGFFMEDYLSMVYKRKVALDYDALTVMDGEFYSIYPYHHNYFTLTGVKEGVVDRNEYQVLGESAYCEKRRNLLELKIVNDYPNFLNHYEHSHYFISKKCKPISNSNNRATHILKNGNVYTVCSGKIDTIFELDALIDIISNNYS